MPRLTVPEPDPDDRDRSAEGGLAGRLARLAELLVRLGPEGAPERAALAELQARLRNKRFHLAVLGQFKRGKSTLLNALLGEDVLPASVVPLTAIPTFLVSGPERRVIVHFADGRTEERVPDGGEGGLLSLLSGYVTEEANPHNRLGLSHVEVRHPSPLLAGVTLIDTPGIGSTLRHNTEATLSFLPRCDAALFLVSADPPVTQVEIAFLERVRRRVVRLFYILNKVDYLAEEERREAMAYFRRVLGEHGAIDEETPVFCVSARAGLAARMAGSEQSWQDSGLADVERHLARFLATHKWASSFSPLPPGLVERLLPTAWRRARRARRRRARLDVLVLQNVENLRWATLQNLDQTFRRCQRELQERLDQLAAAILGASEGVAREARHRRGAAAAEVEAGRALAAEIETAREAIGAIAARGAPAVPPAPLPVARDDDGGGG